MKDVYSWEQIVVLIRELTDQLDRDDYDVVLAITRGGMIPGCLISEWLDLRNVMTAAVMFYTESEQRLDEPRFLQFPGDPLLVGKRILLVDDVWDSGKTIMAVKRRVYEAGGQPTVAVIHYKPTASNFPEEEPDFYAKETTAWVVYPWEPV